MARKARETVPEEARALDLAAAEKREDELTAEKALELYGNGQPYERLRYMEEVRSLLDLTGRSIMEMGKRLIVLKANENHGGWLQTLEQLGVHYRFAYRAMNVARRFGKFDNLSNLNASKLDALEDFTDPELQDLNDGKDVLGLNLDEIERTTATALRKRVRDGEKKLAAMKEAHRTEVAKLNETIEDMRIRAEDPQQLTDGQRAGRLIRENYTKPYTFALAEIGGGIRRAMSVLTDAERTEGVGPQELNEWMNAFIHETENIRDLFNEWMSAYENPEPAGDNFADIIEGRADV
ncbi:MAG: hypothetical protein FWD94_01925 [Treponema sp.]|nr:hypothetical protein [Treponema sp.]